MGSVTNTNLPVYLPYQASGFTFSTLVSYASQSQALLKAVTQSNVILGTTASSRSLSLSLNKVKSTMVNYSPTLL
jgi:hypothetical protein